VLAQRHAPSRFASRANRIPERPASVRAAPFPNRITGMMATTISRHALKNRRAERCHQPQPCRHAPSQ
jgi:hypothetical protein